MLRPQETLSIVAGLLAGVSVPLAWLTRHTFHLDAMDFNNQIKVHTYEHLYGTDGTLNVFITIPFWIVAALLSFACLFTLAHHREFLTIPVFAQIACITTSCVLLVLIPFFAYKTSAGYRPDLGWLFALASTALLTLASRSQPTAISPTDG